MRWQTTGEPETIDIRNVLHPRQHIQDLNLGRKYVGADKLVTLCRIVGLEFTRVCADMFAHWRSVPYDMIYPIIGV
jgi:hypothetical protein